MPSKNNKKLKQYLRDKIRDVSKLCAKNTASAFNLMINKDVIPMMVTINTKPINDLFDIPDDNVVIISDISGDLSGTMIAAFKADASKKVINTLLQRDIDSKLKFDEQEQGALKEYINVIGGAFLSEFGNQVNVNCFPEIPQFQGEFKEIQDMMVQQLKALNDYILLINSSLNIVDWDMDAVFYILFDNDSLYTILNYLTKGNEDEPFE